VGKQLVILGVQLFLGANPKNWRNNIFKYLIKKKLFQESMHHRYRLKLSIFKVV